LKSDTQVEMREAAVVEKFAMDPVEEPPAAGAAAPSAAAYFRNH